jgi:plastocyanin
LPELEDRLNRFRLRPLALLIVALASLLAAVPARAVEPGVDIAAHRVITSQVNAALAFVPRNPVVEQGDYVRWQNLGAGLHTSTSGPACAVRDGLWDFALGAGVVTPARQFNEAPGVIPYNCSPHCGLGMTGSVTVTGLIGLAAAQSGSILTLTWSGGSGRYQVVRSDNALFAGANTQILAPDGGVDTGTTFTDSLTQPLAGKAAFYLVINRTLN